jgi:hypothetical protein
MPTRMKLNTETISHVEPYYCLVATHSFPRAAWECGQGALRRESQTSVLRIRDAARPALHSHAARGNEAASEMLACKDEGSSLETGAPQ